VSINSCQVLCDGGIEHSHQHYNLYATATFTADVWDLGDSDIISSLQLKQT
jgi:hypothetical protein